MRHRNLAIFCADAFVGFGGGAPRFIQMAAGLKAHGWNSTLVRARAPSVAAVAAAKEFPGTVIETPFPAGPWPIFMDRRGLRFLYRKIMRAVGRGRSLDDPDLGWASGVGSDKFVASLEAAPDAVMGVSFGGLTSIWAAKVFADIVDRPLFLEFRDPCPGPDVTLNEWEQRCLNECMRTCAAAITTTDSYAAALSERYPDCAHKIQGIHTAFEDCEVEPRRRATSARLELLHAGAIYGKKMRTADAILFALRRAVDECAQLRHQVTFRLLGGWIGADETRARAKELGIAEMVEIQDAVPYLESVREMEGTDILVVIQFLGENSKHRIPGKVMHYLGRRKPILAIMDPCEAGAMIERSGMGKVYAHEDIDGISSYIMKYAKNRVALNQDFLPNLAYISQYSLTAMAAKLATVLQDGIDAYENRAGRALR